MRFFDVWRRNRDLINTVYSRLLRVINCIFMPFLVIAVYKCFEKCITTVSRGI